MVLNTLQNLGPWAKSKKKFFFRLAARCRTDAGIFSSNEVTSAVIKYFGLVTLISSFVWTYRCKEAAGNDKKALDDKVYFTFFTFLELCS